MKKFNGVFGLFLCLCFSTSHVSAQTNIPLGNWRIHISYNNIRSVTTGNNKIYGAALNGILVLDRDDNSLTSYSRINGLAGTPISFINYDNVANQLLIADDDLDIVKENTIINFNRLKDPSISGSKKINHITFKDGNAYLSVDYGLVVCRNVSCL